MSPVSVFTGVVFHDPVPQMLSFDDAQTYCRSAGAELASTAQLYLAWSQGLDYCSPGWLSDGSVRYPITSPRDRCGGLQAGVRTLYRFRNQTGFPDPHSPHDVYCFKREYLCFSNYRFNARKTNAERLCLNVFTNTVFHFFMFYSQYGRHFS